VRPEKAKIRGKFTGERPQDDGSGDEKHARPISRRGACKRKVKWGGSGEEKNGNRVG